MGPARRLRARVLCVLCIAAALSSECAGPAATGAANGVSSRAVGNKLIGLDRIKAARAKVTNVEMALFELLRDAGHDAFKRVVGIVKQDRGRRRCRAENACGAAAS